MGVSEFTVALWLASAPVSTDGVQPVVPVLMASAATGDPDVAPSADAPSPVAAEPALDPEQTDIVVTAGAKAPPEDPAQAINKQSFVVVQAVDSAFVAPVASAYKSVIPVPVRSGIHNFLYNLHEPEVFLNYVLQHKIGKAAETFGRFVINSTIGVFGLFDVAKKKPFNLRYHYNGFANTLGFYGVKPGPYMYLPLVGATTVRDLIGYGVDKLVLPVGVGKPFTQSHYNLSTGVLSTLDHRNAKDAEIQRIREGAVDPYAAVREAYFKERQGEIDELHGIHHAPEVPATAPAPAPPLR